MPFTGIMITGAGYFIYNTVATPTGVAIAVAFNRHLGLATTATATGWNCFKNSFRCNNSLVFQQQMDSAGDCYGIWNVFFYTLRWWKHRVLI